MAERARILGFDRRWTVIRASVIKASLIKASLIRRVVGAAIRPAVIKKRGDKTAIAVAALVAVLPAVAPGAIPATSMATIRRYPPDSTYESLSTLVGRIRTGKTDGLEELYRLFSKGIRFYLCRQLGPQELDDKVHDTFVVVVQAIRRGELREPERLMGFVRTIVRRLVAAHIDQVVHTRRDQMDLELTMRIADPAENPEETAMFRERSELIQWVLDELPVRDREILTRFYLQEEGQDQICSEMDLTDTQFRLLKSRAKARFGELGKKKLAHGAVSTILVRTSAASSH
jgi:RNA polymerase sigma-70 factor (ECF subfamily)